MRFWELSSELNLQPRVADDFVIYKEYAVFNRKLTCMSFYECDVSFRDFSLRIGRAGELGTRLYYSAGALDKNAYEPGIKM